MTVVRVALGVMAVVSSLRTLTYGWSDSLYSGTSHRFTYLWLGWVPQPGPVAIRIMAAGVALAGLLVALGWHTRVSAVALLVCFTWIELIDATTYLNHYWFMTLMAALAVVAPLGAAHSLDARRCGGSRTVAVGWVWLIRFQVGIVYASAGLAKLQADWLRRGLPLRLWLPARTNLPVVGGLLDLPETAHVLSVAGAAFDVSIVALLLWKRTRFVAWLILVAFHVSTWILFPIGVFPWLMIGVSTVFFAPDFLDRLRSRWTSRRTLAAGDEGVAHRAAAPDLVVPAADPELRSSAPSPSCGIDRLRPSIRPSPSLSSLRRWLLMGAAMVWVSIQLALPLRHLAYPGDHRWTGEGYRFGWNVLLVERTGLVTFVATEPSTGRSWTADPERLYTRAQIRVMSGEPDLIHQAAMAIRDDEASRGHRVEVRVDAWMSFNGRPAARWIDPEIDLAAQPRTLWHKDWILPPP